MKKVIILIGLILVLNGCNVFKTSKPDSLSDDFWNLAIQCIKDIDKSYKKGEMDIATEACVSLNDLEMNEDEKEITVKIASLSSLIFFINVAPGMNVEEGYNDLYEDLKEIFGNNI